MFGIDLIDAGMVPALIVALVAGIISFLSPCVLPIVPPYLAYISGVSISDMSERKNTLTVTVTALFFVLGLSTVFLILGFTASAMGTLFLSYQSTFNTVAGLLVMVFGLHFLGIIKIGFLDREMRVQSDAAGGSAFGAYLLGLAFAFGWTPCIGPQLSAILTLAASEASLVKGTVLLGVYAAGLGVPFLIFALFLNRMSRVLTWFKSHLSMIEKTMGLLLWTIGLLMLSGGFADISYWLLDKFPILSRLG